MSPVVPSGLGIEDSLDCQCEKHMGVILHCCTAGLQLPNAALAPSSSHSSPSWIDSVSLLSFYVEQQRALGLQALGTLQSM